MAIPVTVSRVGNELVVILDDGSEYRCVPTGYGYWVYTDSRDSDPEPQPSNGFKFPFPREQHTSYEGHSGVDWPGGTVGNNAAIRSVGNGVVSAVYDTNWNTTPNGTSEPIWRGICVVINHGTIDGHEIFSLYAHMSSRSVGVGDTVVGGQQIGVIGNTGYSFGTHLHFEINIDGRRRPTDSVPSGYTKTMQWMDAHASGSW